MTTHAQVHFTITFTITFYRRVVGSTPLYPSGRDLGQGLCLQLPARFGVKLRYSICAVVGSASE